MTQLAALYANNKGNKVIEVLGEHEHQEIYPNQTVKYYDALLWINGVSDGLIYISAGQVKKNYPNFRGIAKATDRSKL